MSLPFPDQDAGPGVAPSEEASPASGVGLQDLDPFSFHGFTASVIGGIGGETPNSDPAYAFHTHYVPLARGRVSFNVHFENMRAKLGTLVLRVHMLDNDSGLPARMVTSERIQLNRLAMTGSISVTFEAFRGATYALMGLVAGQTDAYADAIQISVDRPYDEAGALAEGYADGERTQFAREDVRRSPSLLRLATPTLEYLRSQSATPNQFQERIYRDWERTLGIASTDPLDRWSCIYTAQGLSIYQAIGPGARGLVLGPVDYGFATWLADVGAILTFADVSFTGNVIPDERRRVVDLSNLPRDLCDFDFVCSLGMGERLNDVQHASSVIEKSFACLRPLGLGIHVVGTGARSPGFSRGDVERLALNLVSRHHEVSQLRSPLFRDSDAAAPGAFGFAVRRAKMSI